MELILIIVVIALLLSILKGYYIPFIKEMKTENDLANLDRAKGLNPEYERQQRIKYKIQEIEDQERKKRDIENENNATDEQKVFYKYHRQWNEEKNKSMPLVVFPETKERILSENNKIYWFKCDNQHLYDSTIKDFFENEAKCPICNKNINLIKK